MSTSSAVTIGITGHQKLEDPQAWDWVRDEIRKILGSCSWSRAYSSLAAGADQEFAAEAIAQGVPLYAIIPCARYEEAVERSGSLKRYNSLMSRISGLEVCDFPEPSEEAFLAAGIQVVNYSQILVAVWNGAPAKSKGGTGDIVHYAQSLGRTVYHIHPVERTFSIHQHSRNDATAHGD